jgi:hypothetical protein
VIGKRLGVPVVSKSPDEAEAHFRWEPKEKGLIEDLDQPYSFKT